MRRIRSWRLGVFGSSLDCWFCVVLHLAYV